MEGAVATHISTEAGGEAARAIDGNAESNWQGNSCTHTQGAYQPWWKVVFPSPVNIAQVKLTNRGDCCGERLDGAVLSLDGIECASGVIIGQGQTGTVECVGSQVTELKVSLPGSNSLTLCEVQVMELEPQFPPVIVSLTGANLGTGGDDRAITICGE